MNATDEVAGWLREDGQLAPGPAVLTPLTGGISCDIYQVVQAGRTFVVKRALAKLRVAAEWFADVSRNAVEYEFYREMAPVLAGSIPQVFFHNAERGYFLMEYLGNEWRNWKTILLQGEASAAHGELAGTLMGNLHASTWGEAPCAARFDTTANFKQLRTDPYLRAAAERAPDLRAELLGEADRLDASRYCLVHGDFSPKNLLIYGDRMMLLDAEVAWYGDPVFDIAFLQTHLFLKQLHLAPRGGDFLHVAEVAWSAYQNALGAHANADLAARSARLLTLLLLARVDGKSPVEYLAAGKRDVVRKFVRRALAQRITSLPDMRAAWREQISSV